MKRITQTGFTIVELIVVIVVIGILATIALVSYSGMQQRATDAVLKENLRQAVQKIALAEADGEDPEAAVESMTDDNYGYRYFGSGEGACIDVHSVKNPAQIKHMILQDGSSAQNGKCPGSEDLVEEPYPEATAELCFVTRDITSTTVAVTDYRGGAWESSSYRTASYMPECPADAVVPRQIGGKAVVAIETTGLYMGDYYKFVGGFAERYMSSVVIPTTVTSIGDGVFSGSHPSGLEITIPNSVTSIGRMSFDGVPVCRIPASKTALLEDAGCGSIQSY